MYEVHQYEGRGNMLLCYCMWFCECLLVDDINDGIPSRKVVCPVEYSKICMLHNSAGFRHGGVCGVRF